MKERREKLNQIAEDFTLDTIYSFGSNSQKVVEWLAGGISDVDMA